jgi:plastocyanin
MKRARSVLGGLLILAAVCLVPAVSAAQSGNGPADQPTTTTPAPDPAAPPASDPTVPSDPATPAPSGGGSDGSSGDKKSDSGDQATPVSTATTAQTASPSNGSSKKAHKSATTTVNMVDFAFQPASVSVHVGDLVTWRNTGREPHTATADNGSFDTGTVPAGGSGSHMFTQTGNFSYICTIHPNMKGTVRVLSNGGGAGASAGGGGSTSATGDSEAAAVASPDAAGNAKTLPASGMAAGVLALIGLALLASGVGMRFSTKKTSAPNGVRQLTLF